MPSRPHVTVVMAVHNGEQRLTKTIESVLRQKKVDLEYIIVDDGSTDTTDHILQQFKCLDSRIRLESIDQNVGLTKALIRGCELAKGEYIARQDVGDLSLASRLRRQSALLDSVPEVAFVSCGYKVVSPNDENLMEIPGAEGAEATRVLREADPRSLCGPHHGTVMFRKSAYEAVGGYRAQFHFAQDLDLWTRLVTIGKLDFVPEVLYQVSITYDSITARFGAQQRRLRHLIAQATQRRERNEPEDDLLLEASFVRKPTIDVGSTEASIIDTDYFIGSCLAARRDRAACRYFVRILRKRPLHGRAWAKLLWSYAARKSASE